MAKKIDPMVEIAVAALPESGEVTYDEWKNTLVEQGNYKAIPATRTAKLAGLVTFRNDRNEAGQLVTLVGRSSAGGQ